MWFLLLYYLLRDSSRAPRIIEPLPIPRLYPLLNVEQFYDFLTEQQYQSIKQLPLVRIYPPYVDGDDRWTATAAVGLSRMLIRDLMLVPELSVLDAESTPLVTL